MIASNGTTSRSGTPPNDSPTSNASSLDLEIPELVLQHDGHFFGILRAQPVRQPHAFGGGVEGDEEMMVAGQALVLPASVKHVADHAAQRLLDQDVVADVIDGHGTLQLWLLRHAMLTRRPPKWHRGSGSDPQI